MKNKKVKIILAILVCIIAVFVSVCLYITNSKLSKIKAVQMSKKPSDLKIDTKKYNDKAIEDKYKNILLLGEDSRDKKTDPGRSDSMMILTLDKAHNKLKLTSLMRDMLVDNTVGLGTMKGKTQDKLNQAYTYGGSPFLIQVINSNFSMNIKDFIEIDFTHFDKVIDAIGGVDINVSDSEVNVANSYISEVAKIEKITPPYLKKGGFQHLNGIQALGYCRIRYVGNNDYERTQRQRTVLAEIFKKLSKMNIQDMSPVLDMMLSNVTTSLSYTDILSVLSYISLNHINSIEQFRLPEDKPGYHYDMMLNNVYFLGWDKEKNVADLHQFIFEGDIK